MDEQQELQGLIHEVEIEVAIAWMMATGAARETAYYDRQRWETWIHEARKGTLTDPPDTDWDLARRAADVVARRLQASPPRCNVVIHLPDNSRNATAGPLGYDDPKMEERDQWIYETRKRGTKNPELISALEEICCSRQWELISTDRGIREAIKRYCSRTGAPPLQNRQGGRPKGETRK